MIGTVALPMSWCQSGFVRGRAALAAFGFCFVASEAHATAPIYDPVTLNIGINCQWQQRCQRQQTKAMNDARKFIAAYEVPLWRIQVCNKNARRGPARLDWVGFNSCIRNPALVPPATTKRRRH
jgi:hypothetical protein